MGTHARLRLIFHAGIAIDLAFWLLVISPAGTAVGPSTTWLGALLTGLAVTALLSVSTLAAHHLARVRLDPTAGGALLLGLVRSLALYSLVYWAARASGLSGLPLPDAAAWGLRVLGVAATVFALSRLRTWPWPARLVACAVGGAVDLTLDPRELALLLGLVLLSALFGALGPVLPARATPTVLLAAQVLGAAYGLTLATGVRDVVLVAVVAAVVLGSTALDLRTLSHLPSAGQPALVYEHDRLQPAAGAELVHDGKTQLTGLIVASLVALTAIGTGGGTAQPDMICKLFPELMICQIFAD